MTTPADPFAVLRTKKYLVLLVMAAVLGVVISFLTYWFLKLIADIQTWVFTDLPKGLGFHGEPSWWPLLPLAVAGVIVGASGPTTAPSPRLASVASKLPGSSLACATPPGLKPSAGE